MLLRHAGQTGVILLLILCGLENDLHAAEIDDCRQLAREGKYEECLTQAQQAIEKGGYGEAWPQLVAEVQTTLGRYPEAVQTLQAGVQRYGWTARLRWQLIQIAPLAGQPELVDTASSELAELVKASPWRYTDAENLCVLGRWALRNGADAKEVKQTFFERARKNNPAHREPRLALGELALDKQDYQLAAEVFREAVTSSPQDLDFQFGLARAIHGSDPPAAGELIATVLTANPQYVPALLWQVDRLVERERYPAALAQLETVLALNGSHPEALAWRSALAFIEGQDQAGNEWRVKALAVWPQNPAVDSLIGREMSQKYRFAEGAQFQRQALELDSAYLPAQKQLADDLLRLGQEAEGWQLAETAANADGYDVTLYNLVTLRDELEKFATLEAEGFKVRMAPQEVAVYGSHVLDLLQEARRTLATKYQVELREPTLVEIFPKPDDFAVRTFGLPGAGGYLGVCFGNVITANSPASQATHPVSWESVLWHEFAHVVTLNKTQNRMPRWLSEGISVYEERQRDTAWGEHMTPAYRDMILGPDLTPIAELSSAFLTPKSALHVQFAYYESSLVVEFLIENYGFEALLKILDDLGQGLAANEAIPRHTAPLPQLEDEFRNYATELAKAYGPGVDWSEPNLAAVLDAPDTAAATDRYAQEYPANYSGLVACAQLLIQQENWPKAIPLLEQAYRLFPHETGAEAPAWLLAQGYQQTGQSQRELQVLQELTVRDANHAAALNRLLEVLLAAEDWPAALAAAQRLRGVKPLIPQPHLGVVLAGEKTGNFAAMVPALTSLLAMDPDDPADLHYRLATAYEMLDDRQQALRHVLLSLEHAPRYRAALAKLQLLAKHRNGPDSDRPPLVPIPESIPVPGF